MKSEIRVATPGVKIYIAIGITLALVLIVAMLLYPDAVRAILYSTAAAILVGGCSRGLFAVAHGWQSYRRVRLENDRLAVEVEQHRQHSRFFVLPRTDGYIDVVSGIYHAPAIGAGGPAAIVDGQAVEVATQPPRQLADVVGRAKKHIATLGATQAGKTSTMLHITDMLYSRYGDAAAIACDPHANETDWPSFVQVVQSYDDITATLEWLFNEMLKRQQPGAERGQPIILMIDELPAVMDEAADMGVNAKRFIKRLSREGWKFNIYLVLATQTGTVEDLGLNASVRENFTWIKLDERDTQRNQATIVEYRHFKPLEPINLCGPYHAHGGRWFSATRPALPLPQPVEVEPDADIAEFVRLVNEDGLSRREACMQVFGVQYGGAIVGRLKTALDAATTATDG